jgi:hypothetical protein
MGQLPRPQGILHQSQELLGSNGLYSTAIPPACNSPLRSNCTQVTGRDLYGYPLRPDRTFL